MSQYKTRFRRAWYAPVQSSVADVVRTVSNGGKPDIFLIAILPDVVYRILELKAFYPVEAPVVAILLAFIPYPIVRGPAVRLAWRFTPTRPGSFRHDGRPAHRDRRKPFRHQADR